MLYARNLQTLPDLSHLVKGTSTRSRTWDTHPSSYGKSQTRSAHNPPCTLGGPSIMWVRLFSSLPSYEYLELAIGWVWIGSTELSNHGRLSIHLCHFAILPKMIPIAQVRGKMSNGGTRTLEVFGSVPTQRFGHIFYL